MAIPDDCATLVAVPALLLNEQHVRDLVMDMEIRYLANRDPNIVFALVTDSRRFTKRPEERDEVLSLCEQLVRAIERAVRDERPHAVLSASSIPRLQPVRGTLDRMGAQARQAARPEPAAARCRDRFPVKVGNLSTRCGESAM